MKTERAKDGFYYFAAIANNLDTTGIRILRTKYKSLVEAGVFLDSTRELHDYVDSFNYTDEGVCLRDDYPSFKRLAQNYFDSINSDDVSITAEEAAENALRNQHPKFNDTVGAHFNLKSNIGLMDYREAANKLADLEDFGKYALLSNKVIDPLLIRLAEETQEYESKGLIGLTKNTSASLLNILY